MNCWFCSVRMAEEKDTYRLDMHGEVDSQSVYSKTSVAYNVRHIEVPRCHDCHRKHRIAKFSHFMSLVFLVVFAGSFAAILFNWVAPFIAGLWCGLSGGLLVAALLSGILVQKGIHTQHSTRSKYPEVKQLLSECYSFGSRPRKKIPQSSPPCDNAEKETIKTE